MIDNNIVVSLILAIIILYAVDCLLSAASWLRNRLDRLKDELIEEDRQVIEKYLLGLRVAIEGLRIRIPAKQGNVDEDVAGEIEFLHSISKQLYEVMIGTIHVSGKILAQVEMLPQWPKTVLYELFSFLAAFGGAYLLIHGFGDDVFPQFVLGVAVFGVAIAILIESYNAAKRAETICNVLHNRLETVKDMLGYKRASDAPSYRVACREMPKRCRLIGLLGQVLGRG